jgi:hypothetical protein
MRSVVVNISIGTVDTVGTDGHLGKTPTLTEVGVGGEQRLEVLQRIFDPPQAFFEIGLNHPSSILGCSPLRI